LSDEQTYFVCDFLRFSAFICEFYLILFLCKLFGFNLLLLLLFVIICNNLIYALYNIN